MTWRIISSFCPEKTNKEKTVIRSHQSSSSPILWNGHFPPKTGSVVSNILYFHPDYLRKWSNLIHVFGKIGWVAWNHQLEDVDLQILPGFFSFSGRSIFKEDLTPKCPPENWGTSQVRDHAAVGEPKRPRFRRWPWGGGHVDVRGDQILAPGDFPRHWMS